MCVLTCKFLCIVNLWLMYFIGSSWSCMMFQNIFPFPLLLMVQASVCVCVCVCVFACTNMVYKECEGLKYTYFVFLNWLYRFSNIVWTFRNVLDQKGVANSSNSRYVSYMQYIELKFYQYLRLWPNLILRESVTHTRCSSFFFKKSCLFTIN